MTDNFWDYMFRHPRPGADAFGDYVRLARTGKIPRPLDVKSRRELARLLSQEGVDANYDRVLAIWAIYRSYLRLAQQKPAQSLIKALNDDVGNA